MITVSYIAIPLGAFTYRENAYETSLIVHLAYEKKTRLLEVFGCCRGSRFIKYGANQRPAIQIRGA